MIKIKKVLPIFTLIILLIGTTAFAVDLGLYQDFAGKTMFRFDTESIFVQPALDFKVAKIGYKKVLVEDVYMKADLEFVKDADWQMKYNTLGVGLGYAITDFGQKFRVEGSVRNPIITNVKDWTFDVGLAWQFSLPLLVEGEY